MTISTHVLDTSAGRPAAGVSVRLEVAEGPAWREVAAAKTTDGGRVPSLVPRGNAAPPGEYRLLFDVGAYFAGRGVESFYTIVAVNFVVRDAAADYHVPLLVSPYGYSTYRGS